MTIKPAISIIIPHLRDKQNDAALQIAIDCILDNTDLDYELMIEAVATRRDIYPVLNSMACRARAEWLVFSNSDVFFAPGWATAFYEGRNENSITTGIIGECGAISVAPDNYELHFGVTPETFNRLAFEEWVASDGARIFGHKAHQARGWYFPCLINKRSFREQMGFGSGGGIFPHTAADMEFWEKWAASGKGFNRVNSWCYHLQNFTSDDPGRIENRARLKGMAE